MKNKFSKRIFKSWGFWCGYFHAGSPGLQPRTQRVTTRKGPAESRGEKLPRGRVRRELGFNVTCFDLAEMLAQIISGKKRKSSTRTGLGHQVPFRPKTLSCGGRRAETRGCASNKKEKVETTKTLFEGAVFITRARTFVLTTKCDVLLFRLLF